METRNSNVIGEDKSPTRALQIVLLTLAPLADDEKDRVMRSARAFFGLDDDAH